MRKTKKKKSRKNKKKIILIRKKKYYDGIKCSDCGDKETCDFCIAKKLSELSFEDEKKLDEAILLSLQPKTKNTLKEWLKYEKNTLDDGNCFYSAIYRAMKDKNLGDCMNTLGINTEDETEAIKTLRNLIADNSAPVIFEIKSNSALLHTYSELFENKYEDTSLSNIKRDTVDDIKKKIRTDKIWATTLEFEIMGIILYDLCCELKLKNIYDENSILPSDDLDRKDIIYLFNKNNVHFTYFHKED